MKKLFPLVMAVVMVGSVVLMVMVIRGKTSAQEFRDQSKQLIEQANAVTSRAQTQFEKAQTQFEKAQAELVKAQAELEGFKRLIADMQNPPDVSPLGPDLHAELEKARAATAKAIAELKSTTEAFQGKIVDLERVIEGFRPLPIAGPPARPPSRGPLPPTIQSHDPRLDIYVINAGSDNGIKKGDKFTVFRAGKEIGKIEVARTQPTVSIAVYQKGFPRPSAPFKSGDRLMKVK